MNEPTGTEEERSRRRLKHEIANDFAVISMGLHCLGGIRDEPDQFTEVVEMMSGNLQSLRTRVDSLLAQVERFAASPPHSNDSTNPSIE
jgi:hypothetical protein